MPRPEELGPSLSSGDVEVIEEKNPPSPTSDDEASSASGHDG